MESWNTADRQEDIDDHEDKDDYCTCQETLHGSGSNTTRERLQNLQIVTDFDELCGIYLVVDLGLLFYVVEKSESQVIPRQGTVELSQIYHEGSANSVCISNPCVMRSQKGEKNSFLGAWEGQKQVMSTLLRLWLLAFHRPRQSYYPLRRYVFQA